MKKDLLASIENKGKEVFEASQHYTDETLAPFIEKLNSLTEKHDSLQTEVDEINTNLTAVTEKVGKQSKNIKTLSETIDSNHEEVTERMNGIDTKIETINSENQDKFNEIKAKIKDLQILWLFAFVFMLVSACH